MPTQRPPFRAAPTLAHREPAARPELTLVLAPSLGTTHRMWDAVARRLRHRDRIDVLRVDLPGHGGAAAPGDFTIEELASGLVDVVRDARRVVPTVVAGVSMGGALAYEAAAIDDDVEAFVSVNSALRFGSPEGWDAILAGVRRAGTAAFDRAGTRRGWFTADFAEGEGASTVDAMLDELAAVDIAGYEACARALVGYDGRRPRGAWAARGVAVGASDDRATPAAGMRELADLHDGVDYAEIPGAHLAVVEHPDEAAAILDWVIGARLDAHGSTS